MSPPPHNPAGDAPAQRFDDPTRDIRLPSLPDRPQALVRPEWQAHVRPAAVDPAPAPARESEDAPAQAAYSAPPRPYVLPNEPTDKLSSGPQVRQETLAFDSPASAPSRPGDPGQAAPQFGALPSGPPSSGAPGHGTPSSGPAVRAGDRPRRWPWVALTVLPILVIVAAGLLLVVLFGGIR